MILVDTSVWIDFFRGVDSWETVRLAGALEANEDVAICGPVLMEIRQGIAAVRHQNMSGSDMGDDHKEYFAGEAALKAGGAHNTMNQFA